MLNAETFVDLDSSAELLDAADVIIDLTKMSPWEEYCTTSGNLSAFRTTTLNVLILLMNA